MINSKWNIGEEKSCYNVRDCSRLRVIHRIRDCLLDGLCFLDDEGCSTVAQADSLDKANNRGRDTASCEPQSMHLRG